MQDEVRINDAPATAANIIQIDFVKDDFDRTPDTQEPNVDEAFAIARTFLTQLRSIARAAFFQPALDSRSCSWAIEYLHDDGSCLPLDPRFIRQRNASVYSLPPVLPLTQEVWGLLSTLSPDRYPSIVDSLLLDAVRMLPAEVGPAIVLAATAVEVRSETALTCMATPERIDSRLWAWINDRGDYRKEPSVDERLTVLLRVLGGHSLQDESRLWQIHRELRKARNAVAHQGQPLIGNTPVTPAKAAQLVVGAVDIVRWIETMLPESERPLFASDRVKVEQTTALGQLASVTLPGRYSDQGPDE